MPLTVFQGCAWRYWSSSDLLDRHQFYCMCETRVVHPGLFKGALWNIFTYEWNVADSFEHLLCLWFFDDFFFSVTNFILYSVKSCADTSGYLISQSWPLSKHLLVSRDGRRHFFKKPTVMSWQRDIVPARLCCINMWLVPSIIHVTSLAKNGL